MPGLQRILVVSTTAEAADLERLRDELDRGPVVLAAPTAEAEELARALGVEPQVEALLAPVSFPQPDRGHRLDELVRRHALLDRFRDVVVVADAATSTLLLRVLAPDQLSPGGAVTVVGLARGDRPVAVRRGVATGILVGVAGALAEPLTPTFVLLGVAALVGLVLLLGTRRRHVGRELLLTVAISVVVLLAVIAGSARFPATW